MAFYDTFIRSNKIPREKWKDGLQALVDREFENASTYYTIEEEVAFGTLDFKEINARVNSLVDAKTGQRVNDDYKKIIFSDLDYSPEIGTRYRFNDNIWMVFSTDNIKTDTSSVYVRRCNNTMNWQDKYGNIHEEPCYIDYKITENQIFRNYSVDVPSGRIWVQYQNNEHTKNIQVNSRFIFGKNVYKVRSMGDYDRVNTFQKDSVRTESFYADYDNQAEDDNFDLCIANYKCLNFSIYIEGYRDIIVGNIGFSGKIKPTAYLNGEPLENEEFEFYSTDDNIAKIDNEGNFEFISNGTCVIGCRMKNKIDIDERLTAVCKDEVIDTYTDVINNKTDYIRVNETEDYSVYEYKNGNITNTKYEISCHDVPEYCYKFVTDGNNFSITNLRSCEDSLLKVSYENLRTKEVKYLLIELGGIV